MRVRPDGGRKKHGRAPTVSTLQQTIQCTSSGLALAKHTQLAKLETSLEHLHLSASLHSHLWHAAMEL